MRIWLGSLSYIPIVFSNRNPWGQPYCFICLGGAAFGATLYLLLVRRCAATCIVDNASI